MTKAEDCVYRGGGGADFVSCEYVRVDFSEALPVPGLEIEVTTSSGEVLSSTNQTTPGFSAPPALVVQTTSNNAQASGLALVMFRGNEFSPEWVDVVVRSGDTTAADSRLELKYSCVALTSDDWCWQAEAKLLEVTP